MENIYAIALWTLEGTSSVINLRSIQEPRKHLAHYKVGEKVQAKFSGKTYPAEIVQIGGKILHNPPTCVHIYTFSTCMMYFYMQYTCKCDKGLDI